MKQSSYFFGIFLSGMALVASPVSVFAQAAKPTAVVEKTALPGDVVAKEASGEAVMEAKVEYMLPYPGILPDHPLFFLKRFRDWLLERLIADPLKKAEFYVLQGDKMLNMGVFLSAKGQGVLSGEIIAKAEGYTQQAVGKLKTLKDEGKEVPANLVDKIEKSLAKHLEVLTELAQKADGVQKEAMEKALETVKKLQGEIGVLKQ